MIAEVSGDHGDVRTPRKLHDGIRIGNDGQLVIMRSLAESVERGSGEELRAAHHPIEMIDRHCLGFGDAVDVDVEGHAVFDTLIHQSLHRFPADFRFRDGCFDLNSSWHLVHGQLLSLQACRPRAALRLLSEY